MMMSKQQLKRWAIISAFMTLSLLGAGGLAAEYKFGINAEVSYQESEAEVRQRYQPMLEELGKLTRQKFVFYPVYSDRVEQAVQAKQFDFLLVHTHIGLKAEKEQQFQVVGFTDDRKNNQVFFFVRPDSPVKTLADMAQTRIGVPGMQSWATATARGALSAAVKDAAPQFVATRFQDAVPFMVELNTVSVGVTRSQKLMDSLLTQKKARVIHTTPALPLSVMIASPTVPPALVVELRDALAGLAKSKTFESLAFKSFSYSADQNQHLHTMYR